MRVHVLQHVPFEGLGSMMPWLRSRKATVTTTRLFDSPALPQSKDFDALVALGGPMSVNDEEVGWLPVYACEHSLSTFNFPEMTEAFHWHGETFDLPAGSAHLAKSEGCFHQAFQIGPRAIGLQFHLETTPESADALITNCRHELVPARYVQSEHELRSVFPDRYIGINTLMDCVLTYITRRGN